jgi:muconolactone delta-isomerase
MLYHLDVDLDYGRLGSDRDRVLPVEWERTRELRAKGVILIAYRKASAQGVIEIWDCPSHDAVRDHLMGMPLYPYFTEVRLTPLVALPAFAGEDPAARSNPANPCQLDADIDYGRIGPDRDRLLAAERERSRALLAQGIMLSGYRKANARGVIAFWDCPSHDTLRETVLGMPLSPYFSALRVTPLTVHPIFTATPAT